MKRYYNLGTNTKNDICLYYIGMDSYDPNGTVIASDRCKRCLRHKLMDRDLGGYYVECDDES
jgi:hypothetical protein